MSNESDAKMLRAICLSLPDGAETATLERIASRLESDAKRDAQYDALQDIGKSAYESIAEMVAALECEYDRLEELDTDENNADINSLRETDEATELVELREAAGDCESREDAEQRIQEDPLSVEVRSGWYVANEGHQPVPEEFCILLGTGGPATRIIGELNEYGEPTRATLQAQDWGTPWTEYRGGDSETLLTYCRCFYFGEG